MLKKAYPLIVAVSGGADSVALLNVIYNFYKDQNFDLSNIIIAHLNHALRGKDSDEDEKLVKSYAKKFGLKFESLKLHWDAKNKANLEAKCRQKRYEFLNTLKKKYKAKYILTAHHLNDNLETFLLNFTRGAGLNGLKGMNFLENDILRPFLNLTKAEILNYCKKNKLKFREDMTNQDETFARNRIRLKVLPELLKINENLYKTFETNLANLRDLFDFFENYVVNWINGRDKFPVKEFRLLDKVLQKQILIHIYKKIHKSTYNLQSSHIDQILKILNSGKGNVKKEFGPKIFIKIDKGLIVFA